MKTISSVLSERFVEVLDTEFDRLRKQRAAESTGDHGF
jgi:hypothetical protein